MSLIGFISSLARIFYSLNLSIFSFIFVYFRLHEIMEVTSNGDVPSRDIVKKDTAETAFKAPSFVLAGKKKIKASSEAQKAFQSPTSKSEPPGTQICDQSNADEAEKISQEDPQPVDSVSDAGSQKAPYSTPALDSAPEGPSPVLIKQELSPAEQLKVRVMQIFLRFMCQSYINCLCYNFQFHSGKSCHVDCLYVTMNKFVAYIYLFIYIYICDLNFFGHASSIFSTMLS